MSERADSSPRVKRLPLDMEGLLRLPARRGWEPARSAWAFGSFEHWTRADLRRWILDVYAGQGQDGRKKQNATLRCCLICVRWRSRRPVATQNPRCFGRA